MTAPQGDSFGPYGWEPKELPWRAPDRIDPNDAGLARSMIPAYERYLAPASPPWVSGRVATLMSHYYTPDMPQALGAAVFGDWIDILDDLPAHAIQEAAKKWLRTEPRRRPGPGDIRELAMRLVGDEIKTLARLRKLADLGERQNSPSAGVISILARGR